MRKLQLSMPIITCLTVCIIWGLLLWSANRQMDRLDKSLDRLKQTVEKKKREYDSVFADYKPSQHNTSIE